MKSASLQYANALADVVLEQGAAEPVRKQLAEFVRLYEESANLRNFLASPAVETPEMVAVRIRKALPHVPAERLIVAPDCGMKYLPHDVAFGKMQAMVEGAAIVRNEATN